MRTVIRKRTQTNWGIVQIHNRFSDNVHRLGSVDKTQGQCPGQ
jgi:hypothetical protein